MDQNDRPFWPLWPYDSRPQRSALNQRSTVMAAPRNAMYGPQPGYAGSQSGEGAVPPSHMATDDWMMSQGASPDYGAGMTGTQSGPMAVEPQIYDELVDILRRYGRGVEQAQPRDTYAREFYKYRR